MIRILKACILRMTCMNRDIRGDDEPINHIELKLIHISSIESLVQRTAGRHGWIHAQL